MWGSRAFTLLELMVILVILAILITVALPQMMGTRADANETAAITTLRLMSQAQLGFANRKEADLNGDGIGEFGTFGEMSGNVAVRAAAGGTRFLEPSLISPAFRLISPLGEMYRNGYYFRLYLPAADGTGLTELPGGGAQVTVDPDNAQSTWCLYAWPQRYGSTGRRTFFVSQQGDITFADNPGYEGPGAAITAGAAFTPPGPVNDILGSPASGAVGRDGNLWRTAAR